MTEKIVPHRHRYEVQYYSTTRHVWLGYSTHRFAFRARRVARFRESRLLLNYRVVDTRERN